MSEKLSKELSEFLEKLSKLSGSVDSLKLENKDSESELDKASKIVGGLEYIKFLLAERLHEDAYQKWIHDSYQYSGLFGACLLGIFRKEDISDAKEHLIKRHKRILKFLDDAKEALDKN